MRRAIIASLLLLGTAPPPPSPAALAPGQWHKADHDLHALVNGAERDHLPVSRPGEADADACLAPGDAATPARWLLGEGGVGCTIDREDYAGGRVAVHASCPASDGEKPGSLTATGVWTRDRIRVHFASLSYGAGQTFGFNGVIDARRTGDCRH